MSILKSLKGIYEKVVGEGLEMGHPSKIDDTLKIGAPSMVNDSLVIYQNAPHISTDSDLWNGCTRNSPKNFVDACREKIYSEIVSGRYRQRIPELQNRFLENPETDWITNGDLDYLAKMLDLTDTAFLNFGPGDGTHWTVILNASESSFIVYDPLTTRAPKDARKVKTSEILDRSSYRPNIVWLSPDLDDDYSVEARGRQNYNPATYLMGDKYNKLNEAKQIIAEFGALQDDASNCGLYCLFFAKKIETLDRLEFY